MYSPITPKLTVVTVVKDAKVDFLRTAQSLQGLIGSEIEWVVVDGGSRDGTAELIKSLGGEMQINSFSIPPNGIYNAMNFAISKSSGKWIWFLNAGDIVLDPQIAKTFFDSLSNIDWETQLLALPVIYRTHKGRLFSWVFPEIYMENQVQFLTTNHQGTFVRKKALDKYGPFDEKLKFAADGKLLDMIARNCQIQIGRELFIGFTMGGTSAKNYSSLFKEIEQYRNIDLKKLPYKKTVLKNFLRSSFLRFEENPFLRILSKLYLNKRQKKLLEEISTYDIYLPSNLISKSLELGR
jgi:glycosyltransferase involved in cell wall biosynthesis